MPVPESIAAVQRWLETLLRLNASRRVYARQAEAASVTVSQSAYLLLRRLAGRGTVPIGELARLAQMDPGAAHRQVVQLEKQGLVRREPSPDDGRVSLVVLTDAGEQVRSRVAEVMDTHMAEVLGGWSERDRREFGRLLGRFVQDLRASGYHGPDGS